MKKNKIFNILLITTFCILLIVPVFTYPLLKKYEAESRVLELDATKPTSELLNIVLEVLNEHNN